LQTTLSPLWHLLLFSKNEEPWRKVIAHIDNAPIYNAQLVTERIASEKLGRIPYPQYSPDFASYDFFLFDMLKRN
jgi:hypothetical protein